MPTILLGTTDELSKAHAIYDYIKKQIKWNKGLISEDRRNKPTLPLTIPHSIFKSSTKDLSSIHLKW